MTSTNESQIVGEFIPAGGGVAGQEDAATKESKTLDIQSWPSQIVGIHVELIPIPLHAGFVGGSRAELMEPRSLERAVPIEHRGSTGKTDQSLDIRIGFFKMSKGIAQKTLISFIEAMVEPGGCFVFSRRERKKSSIVFKLIHDELVQCEVSGTYKRIPHGRWVNRQNALQCKSTGSSRQEGR